MKKLVLALVIVFSGQIFAGSTIFTCELEQNDTFIAGYGYTVKEKSTFGVKSVQLERYDGSWIDCDYVREDKTSKAKCGKWVHAYKGADMTHMGSIAVTCESERQ